MSSSLDHNEVSTLSTVLLTNLDENVFFTKISEFVAKQFKKEIVQVFETFSDGSTQLIAQNGKNIKDGFILNKGHGLSGYVSRTKRAYYSNSPRDPLLANSKREDGVQNELCIPIYSEGTVLGTINIQTKDEARKYSEEDINLVKELLDEIDSALANMRLYLIAKNLNRDLQKKLEQKDKELQDRGPARSRRVNRSANIEIIGHSTKMIEVNNIIKRVAKEDFPVHITGESGTGKKLMARKIHELSGRSNGECVTVHCSAIEESALELELFGRTERPGLIEKAEGGTLILDCVEELPMGVQAKLLRAIIAGEIYNIDSSTPKRINIRLVSTSKASLELAVEEGRFREDLLYRLNIVSIYSPALREREGDIKLLAEHFLNAGKKPEDFKMLTNAAINKLMSYNWSGNVQELRNIMERTYILTEEKYIDSHHLPELTQEIEEEVVKIEEFSEMTLHELEKIHICKTLDHLGGNKTKAAKALGITVKTLYNKLHSYGLVAPKSE